MTEAKADVPTDFELAPELGDPLDLRVTPVAIDANHRQGWVSAEYSGPTKEAKILVGLTLDPLVTDAQLQDRFQSDQKDPNNGPNYHSRLVSISDHRHALVANDGAVVSAESNVDGRGIVSVECIGFTDMKAGEETAILTLKRILHASKGD